MSDDQAPGGPDQREIRTVQDLLNALEPVKADDRELWFRGHRDISWRLEASVYRTRGHRLSERSMLDRFRQEAATAGLPFAFDDWGWITFAQHHTLPTRLLDWSQSPLVGLYFACEPDPDLLEATDVEADGEFLLLDPRDLNEEAGDDGGGHPLLLKDGDPTLDPYRPGHDALQRGKPRAVIAPMIFDRIRFQTGTFTVSQMPQDAEAEPLSEARSLERFAVPGEAKHALREQLNVLGLNEVSIYRDLDRIARRIKLTHGGGS